jgi:hypothetical protein
MPPTIAQLFATTFAAPSRDRWLAMTLRGWRKCQSSSSRARITAPDFLLSERNCTGRAAFLVGTRVVAAALYWSIT